jgi:hypothetical protein
MRGFGQWKRQLEQVYVMINGAVRYLWASGRAGGHDPES